MFLDKQFSVSIKRNTGLRWPRILRPVIVLKPSSQLIDESETGLNLAAAYHQVFQGKGRLQVLLRSELLMDR